jgi:hypothetical protein
MVIGLNKHNIKEQNMKPEDTKSTDTNTQSELDKKLEKFETCGYYSDVARATAEIVVIFNKTKELGLEWPPITFEF